LPILLGIAAAASTAISGGAALAVGAGIGAATAAGANLMKNNQRRQQHEDDLSDDDDDLDAIIEALERRLDRAPECPQFPGLVFPYRGKSVTSYYILDRFKFGLDRLRIDHEKKRLTVHCLQYTHNTRMGTKLSEQVLREFLGHRSTAMTDHYDNPIFLERLKDFQDVKSSVEQFWG